MHNIARFCNSFSTNINTLYIFKFIIITGYELLVFPKLNTSFEKELNNPHNIHFSPSTSTMEQKYNLSFNRKYFQLFKWQLNQILQAKNLEYLIRVKPPVTKEDVTDEETKATHKYADWKADDLKAQPILTCALPIEDQRRVMECKSLYGMLDTLENVYAKKTSIRKTTLLRSLFACKMKPTDSMRSHVDAFMKIIQELNASGVKTEDEIYPCIFFLSVADTWSEVAERVEYRLLSTNPSTLSLSTVTEQLLAEEKDTSHMNVSHRRRKKRSCSKVDLIVDVGSEKVFTKKRKTLVLPLAN